MHLLNTSGILLQRVRLSKRIWHELLPHVLFVMLMQRRRSMAGTEKDSFNGPKEKACRFHLTALPIRYFHCSYNRNCEHGQAALL